MQSEKIYGLNGGEGAGIVATHYYNPDDDREIKGVADPNKINELYQNEELNNAISGD